MNNAMFEEKFIKLVEENGGFEYYQAYRGDVDLILGGKGDTFWYVVMKKRQGHGVLYREKRRLRLGRRLRQRQRRNSKDESHARRQHDQEDRRKGVSLPG